MTKLLTEIADYDEGGSWGRASDGWPGIKGDVAYDMYVFANCIQSIPYGSYVLMSRAGRYGDKETYLRVHADHIHQLKAEFKIAGRPSADVSVARREKYGRVIPNNGNRDNAPLWKATDEA